MSGHSKWSTIRHKKGAADKARSQIFTKIIKELVVAAKHGGSDIDANSRLRMIVAKARAANMPIDTMNKAIKRGAGELDGANYEEGTYEGYAPNGVGVLVEVLTDNKNRTAADVRHIFSKYGGGLGSPGSVSYNFVRVAQFLFPRDLGSEDEFMEHVLESGADDLVLDDSENFEIVCAPENFLQVQDYFTKKEMQAVSADIVFKPNVKTLCTGEDAYKVLRMLSVLEENDDVKNVYSSFDASEEDIEAAMARL